MIDSTCFHFVTFCLAIVNSRGDKRCRITTLPCQLLQPGQEQSPLTPVLWPAQVVAPGQLLQGSSSQPPLCSSSPAPQPVAADAPQHCGAAPRHQRKQGLDDPTGVPSSSPSCVGNVAFTALGGHGLWAGSAWAQGAKLKSGLALSELGAGSDTCQAPAHGPCPARVPQEPPRSPCARHRPRSVRAEGLSCVCWGAERVWRWGTGAALWGQGCPSRRVTWDSVLSQLSENHKTFRLLAGIFGKGFYFAVPRIQ